MTLLDLFPSLKHSYSSMFTEIHRFGNVHLVVSKDRKKCRVKDIARSHSIWLDPVDAPKEFYKHRLHINRVIKWAYKNKYVLVMMTLTPYHRWHNLDGLLRVLSAAWRDLFSNGYGRNRAASVGLVGWVRRLEITINDMDSKSEKSENNNSNDNALPTPSSNSGWHPHESSH